MGDQTLAIVGLGSSNPNPGTTSNFYDGDGNLTLTVNAVGDSTSYQYDADGNQTLEIDGYGSTSAATIHYLYDASGNQTQEIDPVGNTTSFQYDADAEQTLMIQAYGTTSAVSYSYKYDNDGNLTLQTNPNGTSISSSYDLDGNLTQQLWYNNGGTLNNSLSYSYDGDGNILTAGNNAGTYHFAYNADGEQTQVITPSGVTLNYLYDASGNTTQVSDSLGDTVTSQYDANGNLLQRSASAFGAQAGVSFAYDGDGNITTAVRLALIGGVLQPLGSSTYSYDAQGDTTSIVYKNASGGTNDSFGYAYNAAGQVTREVDYNGTTTTYAYDATGQLTSAGAAAYSYDANGNPDKTGYTVGVNNEVTSDGTWSYGYDLDGNLTSKVGLAGGADAGLSWTYGYDPNNELTSAIEKNSVNATLVSATYSYDVFGQRIQSSVSTGGSPVITNYVYNGSNLWATLTSADALQTLYVAGDGADQYFGQMNASSGGVYRTDRLGTVRDLVSTTGTVLDAIGYDAFGNVVSQTTASLAPSIGYAGYQEDAALGGDFTDGRIYDPPLGRFFSEDLIGLGPDSNLYRYVHNDPTNATDPTGHFLVVQNSAEDKWLQYIDRDLHIPVTAYRISSGRWGIVTTEAGKATVNKLKEDVPSSDYWTQNVYRALTTWGTYLLEGDNNFTIRYASLDASESHGMGQIRAQQDDKEKYHPNPLGPTTVGGLLAQDAGREFQRDWQASKEWWVGANVFLKGGEGAKLESEQVLQPVEGNHDYSSLYLENSILLLRKFQNDYYLVGSTRNIAGSQTNGQKLKILQDMYENKQTLRYLQWGQTGLEIGLSLLPLGQTALLLSEGKYEEAKKAALFDAAALLPGLGAGVKAAGVARALKTGSKGLLGLGKALGATAAVVNGIGAAVTVKDMVQAIRSGEYTWGQIAAYGGQTVMMLLGVRSGLKTGLKCFPAGTPVRTPEGDHPIELLHEGDWVLARPEDNVEGGVSACRIEAVHVRVGAVILVEVGGRAIRVTPEPPVYARDRGWVGAGTLQVGDELSAEDGGWVRVEGVRDTGEEVRVYNLTVSDYHTYFVGSRAWDFAIWVHNAKPDQYVVNAANELGITGEKAAAVEGEEAAANAGNYYRDPRTGQLELFGEPGPANVASGNSRVGTGTTAGGMNRVSPGWRSRYGPGAPREHHLVPQQMMENPQFVERMQQIGVQNPQGYIDRQIALTTQAAHSFIHDAGWNARWQEWFRQNPNFTLRDLQQNIREMMKQFNIPRSSRNFLKTYGTN